jgi:hypothetical protein
VCLVFARLRPTHPPCSPHASYPLSNSFQSQVSIPIASWGADCFKNVLACTFFPSSLVASASSSPPPCVCNNSQAAYRRRGVPSWPLVVVCGRSRKESREAASVQGSAWLSHPLPAPWSLPWVLLPTRQGRWCRGLRSTSSPLAHRCASRWPGHWQVGVQVVSMAAAGSVHNSSSINGGSAPVAGCMARVGVRGRREGTPQHLHPGPCTVTRSRCTVCNRSGQEGKTHHSTSAAARGPATSHRADAPFCCLRSCYSCSHTDGQYETLALNPGEPIRDLNLKLTNRGWYSGKSCIVFG